MSTFIVFPFQLFEDIKPLLNSSTIAIVEEPLLFYEKSKRPFRVHKIRIAHMRASMRWYERFLKKNLKNKTIKYVDYDNVRSFYKSIDKSQKITTYNLHDNTLLQYLQKQFGNSLSIVEHNNLFLLSSDEIHTLVKQVSNKQNIQMNHVYNYVKTKMDLLVGQKSLDADNRQKLPVSQEDPRHNRHTRKDFSLKDDLKQYYNEAIDYVERHEQFSKHVGQVDNVKFLPITHTDARYHFLQFIKKRFKHFGPYEDAIDSLDGFIYHSNCSYLINCGLLTPSNIINIIKHYKSRIPLNSYEGYVRQLLGWREYMRFIYEGFYDELIPIFRPITGMLPVEWYKGTTRIDPIDSEIHKVLEEGWCHHIIRLMVFLNPMRLSEMKAYHVYKWFMEMVSLDAYEWVMWSNIAAMGMYTTRFMSKPYLSSSAYILKMSNYKQGPWCKLWDAMFYSFLMRNKSKLRGKFSIYLRNLAYFERLPEDKQKLIIRAK